MLMTQRVFVIFFAVIVIGLIVGCKLSSNSDLIDPSQLLAELEMNRPAEDQLAALDGFSQVQLRDMSAADARSAVGVIRRLLSADDAQVAAKAADLLASWGIDIPPEVVRLLSNTDPVIRFSAAVSLAALAPPAAAEELLHASDDTAS